MGESEMEEDKKLMKFLKWAGIAALVAVPVFLLLKSRKSENGKATVEDEADIFSSELKD